MQQVQYNKTRITLKRNLRIDPKFGHKLLNFVCIYWRMSQKQHLKITNWTFNVIDWILHSKIWNETEIWKENYTDEKYLHIMYRNNYWTHVL